MGAIATWMEVHDDLDRALAALRRVWPEGDADRQRLALQGLRDPLLLHIELEEAVLLPAYAELAHDVPPNGAPHVFRADHDKLRRLLAALEAAIGETGVPAILTEQDRLSRLAGLLEHHDLREKTWFVPTLDAGIDPDIAAGWVAAFAAAEAQLPTETLEPRPARSIDVDLTGVHPVDVLRVVTARDGDVARAFAAVEPPAHPRGERLRAATAARVEAVTAAATLPERRDRLAELADTTRLLAIVAHTGASA